MTLQYDKPLNELWNHEAETKTPNDFIKFWETQKKVLNDIELDYRLEKLDYPSDTIEVFLLSFLSLNNDRIYGYYAKPKVSKKESIEVKLLYHGYNWSIDGDLMSVVNNAEQGFHVYLMNARGQQFSEDSTKGFGNPVGFLTKGIQSKETYYYKYVYLDIVRSIDILDEVLRVYPSKKYIACGGSQGGAFAIVAGALSNQSISCVIATHPFLSDFRRSIRITPSGPYHEISDYLKRNSHIDRDIIFNNLDYFDVTNLASMIYCPILLGIGLIDDIVAPSTTFGVYNRIKCEKYIEVYPEYAHEVIQDFDYKATGLLYNILRGKKFNWKIHPLSEILK